MPTGAESGKWLECNGQPIDPMAYPKLAALMSVVPNYQGVFLRGYGTQSFAQENGSLNGITTTNYSSLNLGEMQGDATRSITGSIIQYKGAEAMGGKSGAFNLSTFTGGGNFTGHTNTANTPFNFGFNFDSSLVVPTDIEVRPVNKAVKYLIKAK